MSDKGSIFFLSRRGSRGLTIPNPKPIFFVFGLSGWPDHPQRPGVASATPIRAGMGWPATPWPKMGWSGHPIFWARGGSSHPDFSLLFFFFFFFNFLLFFIKKKNPKICKTTPFCPKQRSFGVEGIMDIYIYLYTHYTLEGS
jgi:hypothetical protein